MAECIHGFDEGMCDICSPRQSVAAPVAVTTTATRTPPPQARRSLARAPQVAGASSPRQPPFGARRLYHVTHARNLESILLDGAIRSIGSGADPDVDVTAPIVRALRNARDVGDGRTVTGFVPFNLSPDAARWAELRDGATGSHWSAAARLTSATEFVMLVVAANAIGTDVVVADGDASAPATKLTVGEPGKALLRAAREDPELGTVEVLVPDQVPLDAVLLIGVSNEPMRYRVRRMFEAVDRIPPKIVVHTPWFTPAGA
ncbi:MAG: hypothetical protein QOC59_766 [Microbacteriaceae bacterium]|nr:hypothetical protein [Microbacteriaceae bacterium]